LPETIVTSTTLSFKKHLQKFDLLSIGPLHFRMLSVLVNKTLFLFNFTCCVKGLAQYHSVVFHQKTCFLFNL